MTSGNADSEGQDRTAETAGVEPNGGEPPRFMTVKQAAAYLQVNEKKIYALVREGKIPATKLTGKWLFPRDLVDQWLLESSHGGLLTDRIVIAGSDGMLGASILCARGALRGGAGLVRAMLPADLRAPLRAHPDDDAPLKEAIRAAIARKPKGHDFDYSRQRLDGQMPRHMSHTGG